MHNLLAPVNPMPVERNVGAQRGISIWVNIRPRVGWNFNFGV